MKTNKTILTTTLCALAAMAMTTTAAHAKSAPGSKADVNLVSTGLDGDAFGRAKLRVRGADDGRFEIRLGLLDVGATYEVVLDGVPVAGIVTDDGGSGRARFRSRPRSSKDTLLGFDPRGTTLVVRNSVGQDVLAASLPAGGNSIDDSKIVCCVPDDSGAECEDRTPEVCVAEGGTVSDAASCLPNPCDTTTLPVDDDVICCLPDDTATECEDRTVAECSIQGGIVVAATTCVENPCASIPAADPDTRCCLPDDSGNECEDRLPAECLAQGGVDIGPGVCAIDACVGVTFPGSGTEAVRVRCEKRDDRSDVSVDGSGLATGSLYTSRVVSGASEAISGQQAAVLGQAEFDFDSDGGDIAAGAVAISPSFISGGAVTGQILNASGTVVAESTVACTIR